MRIIEEETRSYTLVYEDDQGEGYAFPCDEDGHILWGECYDPDVTKKSIAKCKASPDRWTGKAGEVVTLAYREIYGICPCCGRRVYFGGSGWAASAGVAECDCGKWYNIFGEEILPPKPWEENYWDLL